MQVSLLVAGHLFGGEFAYLGLQVSTSLSTAAGVSSETADSREELHRGKFPFSKHKPEGKEGAVGRQLIT